jgi:hypothetical protein
MQARMDMGNNRIVNLGNANPNSDSDAVNMFTLKKILNTSVAFLRTDGSNYMTGNININGGTIINMAAAVSDDQPVLLGQIPKGLVYNREVTGGGAVNVQVIEAALISSDRYYCMSVYGYPSGIINSGEASLTITNMNLGGNIVVNEVYKKFYPLPTGASDLVLANLYKKIFASTNTTFTYDFTFMFDSCATFEAYVVLEDLGPA